jgi:hypothetical protein
MALKLTPEVRLTARQKAKKVYYDNEHEIVSVK